MVYTPQLWWFWGWFIIVLTTLLELAPNFFPPKSFDPQHVSFGQQDTREVSSKVYKKPLPGCGCWDWSLEHRGQTQSDKRPLLVHWYQPKKQIPSIPHLVKIKKTRFNWAMFAALRWIELWAETCCFCVKCVASLQIGMGQNFKEHMCRWVKTCDTFWYHTVDGCEIRITNW